MTPPVVIRLIRRDLNAWRAKRRTGAPLRHASSGSSSEEKKVDPGKVFKVVRRGSVGKSIKTKKLAVKTRQVSARLKIMTNDYRGV